MFLSVPILSPTFMFVMGRLFPKKSALKATEAMNFMGLIVSLKLDAFATLQGPFLEV